MHAHDLHSLRNPLSPSSVNQGIATIESLDPDRGWLLRLDGRELRAVRAASCLVAPAIGDQVWVAGDDVHGMFVLAVLTRASEGPTAVSVDGDLELRASGELRVHAEAGVELATPAGLALRADTLDAQARMGRLSFVELRAVARSVFATLARVTRVGQLLELLVDTVTQRSNNSYRSIASVDHTQAEIIHQQASADVHISAERALINGEDLVKMDGGQIHLG